MNAHEGHCTPNSLWPNGRVRENYRLKMDGGTFALRCATGDQCIRVGHPFGI